MRRFLLPTMLLLSVALLAIAQDRRTREMPSQANVRGVMFTVRYSQDPCSKKGKWVGCTTCDYHSIEILPSTLEAERTTLLHELLHAETCIAGSSDLLWYNSEPNAKDHNGFYRIADAVFDILNRNPKIAAWLEGR